VVNGVPEKWSLGYGTDVIFTRDAWMHRLDLARATGRDPVLTADHDGIIVADVVAEWARRHGRPYRLELTCVPQLSSRGDIVRGERHDAAAPYVPQPHIPSTGQVEE
jgi:hypothetical protein